ncbi:alpha/beta hydrolase [Chelatococcus reniformis]
MRRSGRPPFETLTPEQARATYIAARHALQPSMPAVAEVRELAAPGPAGEIAMRLFRGGGTRPSDQLPVLVYFHGGGWVVGNLDTHEVPCAWIANFAECAVVSVDYRLAPDCKFPAAFEDAFAATKWVAANGTTLGVDPSRVAVGGDSAGGNLAAAVAIAARDGSGPELGFQLLIYPAVDFTWGGAPEKELTTGVPVTTGGLDYFRDHYLNGVADRSDWRASPMLAESHAGLPPAYVMAAGVDPILSEGRAYASKLEQAGVPVTYRLVEGQLHGFVTMGKFIGVAESEVALAALQLKARLL